MNHKKIYNDIIQNAKDSNRIKYNGVYYEKHHIIPKCVGGLNDSNNLVLLTAKEHFICHKLLIEIYSESLGLKYALFTMTIKTLEGRDYIISSMEHERAREEFIKARDWKNVSDSTRKKISDKLKKLYADKENHPQYNTHRSESTKNKLSIKLSDYFLSEENRNNVALSHGGKWFKVYKAENVIIKNRRCVSATKGEFVDRYCNETLAASQLLMSRSSLHRSLIDGLIRTKKYIFEYENE